MTAKKAAKKVAHLLIVDDDPADVDLLKDYLQDADFDTKTDVAVDGVEGLKVLREGLRPDLVILDLNMPRKNGLQTLKELRADPDLKDLKIIVLTTSDQEEHIMLSFEAEANYFVTKPARPNEFQGLLDLMRDYLNAYVWSK